MTGGVPETTALLEQQWDHIFFTGGPPVGKVVMAAAAKNLTPVVLELGGKNPTIVHSSADLKVAARRIAQGRWMNAGQTCTAPDHVLVFKDVAAGVPGAPQGGGGRVLWRGPAAEPGLWTHRQRPPLRPAGAALGDGELYHGGQHDRDDRFIAPTILVKVPPAAPVMQEEIFGPILPVLEVGSVEEAIDHVNARPSPLGLYVFAEDGDVAERIVDATASGDAAINDCTVQPLVRELPFGGVGNSGMGKYHGEWGFRAYTNARGVLHRGTSFDPRLRYPPYSENTRLRDWLARLS